MRRGGRRGSESFKDEMGASSRSQELSPDAEAWDRQFERDVQAGKLDALAERALRSQSTPLVECAHEARPGEEMTPERVADVLLEEEAGVRRDALR